MTHIIMVGNHYTWIGGLEQLIDAKNNIIIPNFRNNNKLNLFSIKEEKNNITNDPTREYFLGNNNKYLSFNNYEKVFEIWFEKVFLNSLSKQNLIKSSFKTLTFWNKDKGWINQSKIVFIESNFEKTKTKLQRLKKPKADYFVTSNGLN